jgi:hypothetical protein
MNFETIVTGDLVTSVEDSCDEVTMDDLLITGVSRSAPPIGHCLSDLRDPSADFEIAADGKSVELRSDPCDRNGNRVYTVDIRLADDSGNETTRSFKVEMLYPGRG